MKKLFTSFKTAIWQLPCFFCTIKHNCCSKNICLDKNFRIFNTSVNMTFCREMHNTVNIIFFKNLHDSILVRDVRFNESVIISIFNIF